MQDIYHEWGSDLEVGSGGDLAVAAGATAVNQRVVRRLLTNPGDYLWNIDYGGGLGRFVGSPADPSSIEAVVTAQLQMESAVPSTPPPQVSTQIIDPANGYVVANILYADPISRSLITLSVTPG